MRVALVHDYLNQLGGGERVLDALIRMFPEADVYTLLYDEQKTRGRYKNKVKGTSFLDFQFARDHHRLFIPLMPLAARSINLGARYDLIISDTAGFAKGVSYDKAQTKHISYIHTPLRYAWETENYFDNSPQNVALKILAAPLFAYVRHDDYETGQRPDFLFANSRYIAGKVKQYYGRDAQVLYPPVDSSRFYYDPLRHSGHSEESIPKNGSFGLPQDDNRENKSLTSSLPVEAGGPLPLKKGEYYLAAARLHHYKRFDLIIEAFAELHVPLKIVGTGPLFGELSELAKKRGASNIEFLGFIKDDNELRSLYQNAKAFIMANDEDFGLVMAEAQACGTPVIAYGAGGALEIVEQGKTGVLFNEQTPLALIEAVRRFESIDFDRQEISEWAQKFSTEQFQVGMEMAVREITG
jgi:glycosyltransferase involved in cell wall biosynthesis